MAGKLLSTFAFRFRARDRQQKCDSVLPREKKKNYSSRITSFFITRKSLNRKKFSSCFILSSCFIASSREFLKTSESKSEMDVHKMDCCSFYSISSVLVEHVYVWQNNGISFLSFNPLISLTPLWCLQRKAAEYFLRMASGMSTMPLSFIAPAARKHLLWEQIFRRILPANKSLKNLRKIKHPAWISLVVKMEIKSVYIFFG